MKVKTNLVGGVLFIVLGVVLLALLPTQIKMAGQTNFLESNRVIPAAIEVIMIICGIILVVQSLVFKKEDYVDIKWEEEKYALMVFLIFAVFAALVYCIGFLVGAVVFVVLMALFYKNKNIIEILILAALAVGLYFLFKKAFRINLPGFGGKLF